MVEHHHLSLEKLRGSQQQQQRVKKEGGEVTALIGGMWVMSVLNGS